MSVLTHLAYTCDFCTRKEIHELPRTARNEPPIGWWQLWPSGALMGVNVRHWCGRCDPRSSGERKTNATSSS